MDDLKSIVEYHEQALRSIEDQLGRLVENLDRHERRTAEEMATLRRLQQRNDQCLARAFRLGVVAVRRERVRRQEEDRRLEERQAAMESRQAADRAAWEERQPAAPPGKKEWNGSNAISIASWKGSRAETAATAPQA